MRPYLITIDTEKAFDLLDHDFLITVLEYFGFESYFIDWIKIFLNKRESCKINGGVTTHYFKLELGVRQGDPRATYLFFLALEISLKTMKKLMV